MLRVPKRIIEEELHLRHVAQLDMTTDLPLDHAPCAPQAFTNLLLSLAVTDHTVVNPGVPEIAGQTHMGKGDATDPGIPHHAVNRTGDFVEQQATDSL